MATVKIQFTLFSAFYSPLISAMSGGFLKDEGLDYEWSVAKPGVSAIAALAEGSAHVVQSAPSQGFGPLERGETPPAVHFAQINEMDGFFLTGREPEPEFRWTRLEGADVLVHHGGQPLAMFKYACHRAGVDFERINAIDAGNAGEMDAAFRAGTGRYVHQQGPAPQRLAADGAGHVVAQVGPVVGPCAFSSLAATREWLGTDVACAFVRAYRRTRDYVDDAPAAEIARAEQAFFPNVPAAVLTECIAAYQRLGCWTRHVEITRPAYEATLDIFEYNRLIARRHPYEQVCCPPPEG